MKLIKVIDSRESIVKSGKSIGKKVNKKWGEFECPGCTAVVERTITGGERAKTCGTPGCLSKVPNLCGVHKKVPKELHVNTQPYYKVFNDFYNRNLKHYHNLSSEWSTLKKFRDSMYAEYGILRSSGVKALTLFVANHQPVGSCNASWVNATSRKTVDFNADMVANVWHTKMLSIELNMHHYDLVKSLNRLDSSFGAYKLGNTTELGFIGKPTEAYILTAEQYIRLRDRILDLRQGKNSSDNVYLIASNGLTKIGITGDVSGRVRSLAGSNSSTIELVYSVGTPDAVQTEKDLHKLYAEFNVHHEWFNLSKEQVKDIIESLTPIRK
jgi:hypothetical protein